MAKACRFIGEISHEMYEKNAQNNHKKIDCRNLSSGDHGGAIVFLKVHEL